MQSVDVRSAKTTFADGAYRFLLDGIMSLELKPGDSLRARDLAAKLRISITPIERALERLAGEGLVEFRPGKGPFVPEPTLAEVVDLYDARLMIEVHAVQQGIERADDDFLSQMEDFVGNHAAAGAALDGSWESHVMLAQADRNVHLHLVSLWPNWKAQTWFRQISIQIKSFQLVGISGYYRERSIGEHRAIYEALAKRDGDAAAAAVRQHEVASKEWFLARAAVAGIGKRLE